MTTQPIYLDFNASTPIDPQVAETLKPFLSQHFGNPSSLHWAGIPAKEAVEHARQQVAELLRCSPDEIVFTSGGSESNNHAIKGVWGLEMEEIHVSNEKRLLFVCVENALLSQIVQGFAEAIGKGKLEAYSAGSRPSSQIDPLIIEVMKEKGIDLSGRRPKGLDDLPPIEMDYLITMGCEETCPSVPSKQMIEWKILDPKGRPIGVLREVRNLIEEKVRVLVKEIE